jgi:hypothetical protein
VRVPALGIWSTDDHYLNGARMERSGAYVQAPWRYEVIEGASQWIPLDDFTEGLDEALDPLILGLSSLSAKN